MKNLKEISTGFFMVISVTIMPMLLSSCNDEKGQPNVSSSDNNLWYGWNKYQIKPEDTLVRMGHDLIENTAYYFGPKGTISASTNGMNCQNCHIEGGITPWGNNFSAVIISYPKLSTRSGKMMSLSRRINDCFERSLNGAAIDTTGKAMNAIIGYMHWVGDDVKPGKKPLGSGLMKLPYLTRAADPAKGQIVYVNLCARCHGKNGEGLLNNDASAFVYPPLWGAKSYNAGAGLYRLIAFSGFVKNNMPFMEATYDNPKLTDEQAWDVAAFVNSQPRPPKKDNSDFPDVSKKTIDEPFGPYADIFTEQQHKFGPFQPIKDAMVKTKK